MIESIVLMSKISKKYGTVPKEGSPSQIDLLKPSDLTFWLSSEIVLVSSTHSPLLYYLYYIISGESHFPNDSTGVDHTPSTATTQSEHFPS